MYGLVNAVIEAFGKGKKLLPKVTTSKNYKHWISRDDLRRCLICKENHGKIYAVSETPAPMPPIHPNCRCIIEQMKAITAGTATFNRTEGADWTLMIEGTLPDYYISKNDALSSGWRFGRWPSNFIPDKMIAMGEYLNKDERLPSAPGRKWFEADINYTTGKRNKQRVVWSNDGLIFVTYDHYNTFFEVTGE